MQGTLGDGKKVCEYTVLDACEAGVMGINDHTTENTI